MPTFQTIINGCDVLEFESQYGTVFESIEKLLPKNNLKCTINEIDDDGESHYFGEINEDGFTSVLNVARKIMVEAEDWKSGVWKQKCPRDWLPQEDIPF